MNSHQLAVFREIMKTGSVSQAARNLHRTQPAVSATLKTLEEQLGMPLFLREERRLIPVPEAHYLMAEATEILARLQTAEQNLTHMRDHMKGRLRIVAMPGPSSFLLPQFLSDFTAERADLQVTLATRSSPQIRSLIAAQSFDIGFCDISGADDDETLYNSETVEGYCLCALPRNHPLASRNVIRASDLDGLPMGALQPEHSTFRSTKAAFEASGATFNVRFDAQYFLPLFHFLERGQACAVVDVLSAESYRRASGTTSQLVFRPFEPAIPFGYSLLTPHHRPLSRIAQSFLESWRSFVRTLCTASEAG